MDNGLKNIGGREGLLGVYSTSREEKEKVKSEE